MTKKIYIFFKNLYLLININVIHFKVILHKYNTLVPAFFLILEELGELTTAILFFITLM